MWWRPAEGPAPEGPVRITSPIKFALCLWLALEVLAFCLVAEAVGTPRAILLGVMSSLLGLILLRRAGTSAIMKLRANMDGRLLTGGDKGQFLDEMLATAGALALLLPGFLSDIVGLALAVPAVRDRAAAWVKSRSFWKGVAGSRSGPATIDLQPEDWRRGEADVPKPRA